jgi:hypothetical protein
MRLHDDDDDDDYFEDPSFGPMVVWLDTTPNRRVSSKITRRKSLTIKRK